MIINKTFRLLLYLVCMTHIRGDTTNNVSCHSLESGGSCVEGLIGCNEPACDATKPVQINKYKLNADSEENCKKRFESLSTVAYKPLEAGIAEPKFYPNPDDPNYFYITIDWESWINAAGYHVAIKVLALKDEDFPPVAKQYAYKCLEGKNSTTVTIPMEYSYTIAYSNCHPDTAVRQFEIIVKGFPSSNDDHLIYKTVDWPNNCFGIADESRCGPHTPVGAHISVQTSILPNHTHFMSAVVSWSNPLNTMYNVTKYNVLLIRADTFMYVKKFKAVKTYSVIISPLNISHGYDLYLEPAQDYVCQYECTKESLFRDNCGPLVFKSFSYLPPPSSSSYSFSSILPSPSPSITYVTHTPPGLSSSAPIYTSSSHLVTPQNTSSTFISPNPSKAAASNGKAHFKYYKETIIGAVAVVLFVITVFCIILIAIIVTIKFKESKRPCEGEDILKTSSDESSASNTRSPTPCSPWSPVPAGISQFPFPEGQRIPSPIVEPLYHQKPPGTDMKLVLVVESLRLSKQESDINHAFLGDLLNKYGDVHVIHYNTASRATPSSWLMEYVPKANIVLCVCGKEFFEEWKGDNASESLVRPLVNHVIAWQESGKKLSDKYIAIIHCENHKKYIPDIFKSVRYCSIDKTEMIYGLITETPSRVVL